MVSSLDRSRISGKEVQMYNGKVGIDNMLINPNFLKHSHENKRNNLVSNGVWGATESSHPPEPPLDPPLAR